jgi:D-alanyl-D-alanine dipeptidase
MSVLPFANVEKRETVRLLAMIHRLRVRILVLGAILITSPAYAREMLPPGFVYLRDVDSSIQQDIRYATPDNFTGRPLPGYGASECILRRETAEALKRVQADLARENLSLKVYDCYRPTRAVRAMAAWAHDLDNSEATRHFYPSLHKRNLFALGYIAAQSRHSTGTAVDLTLVKLPTAAAQRFDLAARYGPCNGPVARRAPDNSVDMGTGYDCFDVRSYTMSNAINPEQRRWRSTLNTAMHRHGFANYFREWWHYSFAGAAEPRVYDFAIAPRGR